MTLTMADIMVGIMADITVGIMVDMDISPDLIILREMLLP
jgi:hypothetical protein